MVNCKNCQTKNSIDSRFCRNCGVALPDDALKAEREKFDELLAEGYRKFSSNQTEEAFLIAQAAVLASPASASAQSLLGMCHERRGEIALALESYEQVLELNPDSALDKIKVTQLRNSLASHLREEAAPTKKRAALAGVAAAVMLASIAGAIVAINGNAKKSEALVSNDLKPDNGAEGFNLGAQNTAVTNAPPGAGSGTTGGSGSGGGTTGGVTNPPPVQPGSGSREFPRGPSTLPNVNGEVPPVRIEGPIPDGPNPADNTNNSKPNPSGEVEPKIEDGSPKETPPDESTKPKYDPGDIVIKRSAGGPRTNMGGGTDIDRTSTTTQLIRSAREQFQLGRFEQAASLYERAIREGGDAGTLNQRLGQCYEKLGRRDDAIGAYTRAINALESSAKSDPGGRASAALESCKQALTVLKG